MVAQELRAQDLAKRGTPDAEALRSWAVPHGEIHGIVADAETGDPIFGAQVYVETENKQIGALTDSAGLFRIQRVPKGPHVLVAERLGYATTRVSAEMSAKAGIAARFALHPHRLKECGLRVQFYRGCCGSVRVVVRDVLTSRAPPTPVALRVARDSVIDRALRHAEDADVLHLSAGSGEGTFAVEVAADGYAPWYREDVRVELGECGESLSPPLMVWLIPLNANP